MCSRIVFISSPSANDGCHPELIAVNLYSKVLSVFKVISGTKVCSVQYPNGCQKAKLPKE